MRFICRWLRCLLFSMGAVAPASAQDDEAMAYFHQAKIDWQQAKGQTLTIGLNKHPFTESLLTLIPFLDNPKLTDKPWFKLDDFYPAPFAANRWNGTIGGVVGPSDGAHRDGIGVAFEFPAAGEGRGCGVGLHQGDPRRPHVDLAGGRGVGRAARPERSA